YIQFIIQHGGSQWIRVHSCLFAVKTCFQKFPVGCAVPGAFRPTQIGRGRPTLHRITVAASLPTVRAPPASGYRPSVAPPPSFSLPLYLSLSRFRGGVSSRSPRSAAFQAANSIRIYRKRPTLHRPPRTRPALPEPNHRDSFAANRAGSARIRPHLSLSPLAAISRIAPRVNPRSSAPSAVKNGSNPTHLQAGCYDNPNRPRTADATPSHRGSFA